MSKDIRAEAAQYYDVNPTIPDDLAFYQARLLSSNTAVLELGSGTGRVRLPLAAVCGFIYGIDRSLPSVVPGLAGARRVRLAGFLPGDLALGI
jgi:hypothetical protein